MWPLAECISSTFVQTPSLQLGVLQISTRFIPSQSNFLDPTLFAHTSGGSQSNYTRVRHYPLHGPSRA